MAELINTDDKYTNTQFGEKGHVEYGWSNNIREKILQFSYQLTRTNSDGVDALQNILKELLCSLKHNIKRGTILDREVSKGYLSILYRMIGYNRDIIDGKGERLLSYMMIYTWYIFFPVLAKFALKCFVDIGDKKNHPYGSWKDIKYFCEYCRKQKDGLFTRSLIQYAVSITNEQLKHDTVNYVLNMENISLVAKWIPREKSSFGWLYNEFACDYYSHYLSSANTADRLKKATAKCKTDYRKLLSKLNKHIETLQIKQCGQKWSSIDFDKVTSVSIYKQKKALLNIKYNGDIRFPGNNDRIECATKFTSYIQSVVNGETEMKGKRVGMADFTKQALQLINGGNKIEIDLLNSQWRDNANQNKKMGKIIAMVDVSASMEGDPMNVGIALAIRIAEKSMLGKRVMTFSARPTWINLENQDDFVTQVGIIKTAECGMNTNFHAALDKILEAIVQNKMSHEDVKDLVLVVLSDMQIERSEDYETYKLYEVMKAKYEAAGIRLNGKPYKPPHILFWNLKSTSGFPSLSTQKNCSMMSGFSPSILNLFCEKGITALQYCTPWCVLEKSLENPRYKIMAEKMLQEF
jgi:Mg-chelatase subunit ChlD